MVIIDEKSQKKFGTAKSQTNKSNNGKNEKSRQWEGVSNKDRKQNQNKKKT